MARAPKGPQAEKDIAAVDHKEASRLNIPTAEYQAVMRAEEMSPVRVAYERRNRDLDPQLVWRGKDEQDSSALVVNAPPLYIQEKIKPQVLIEDLRRHSAEKRNESQMDLYADFNGFPEGADKTEFYQHEGRWQNRMILGDSLQVMASLAEREGLRGKVQCIYIDPPYGIKFNSNFQWSTASREVKDGNPEHITREPEQVKAFRDTWRYGVHSYLSYLRDRLEIARDLLSESGSIFLQIGDENVHRVRLVMDEVFGEQNLVSQIVFVKTSGYETKHVTGVSDYLLFYAKDVARLKYHQMYNEKLLGGSGIGEYNKAEQPDGSIANIKASEIVPLEGNTEIRFFRPDNITTQGNPVFEISVNGRPFSGSYKTNMVGMKRLRKAGRLLARKNSLAYKRYLGDFPAYPINNTWSDTGIAGRPGEKIYVVQTGTKVVERCILMATDPGDLVLDPTCGSGSTAYVAEHWGRRWITVDTSRVALALARSRIMGARFPYYLLADTPEGQRKEAELEKRATSTTPTHGSIRLGFVHDRLPHITLKSIANNFEIDVIDEEYERLTEPLLRQLNEELKQTWQEWEVPLNGVESWSQAAKDIHSAWLTQRLARQKEIDASIAEKADSEHLYDRAYEDKRKVRVAGPFTVESLLPHRMLALDENDKLSRASTYVAGLGNDADEDNPANFVQTIIENLRACGVQQAHKEDSISFTSIELWPGQMICSLGRYVGENGTERRAGIMIGPEFGTTTREDLVQAAREAGDAAFDVLIACAFNFDAHSSEFNKLGRISVLKARMNADLHMAGELKNTGKGNLFVIFGEPDITIQNLESGQIQVRINGVDVFDPRTGEVRSDDADGIACWLIDTDYNEESFFVRHAYFLGANDPYKALKATLKAEINEEAWETLHSDTSRPFDKPAAGRIAVKVINHLGDEVMKIFRVK